MSNDKEVITTPSGVETIVIWFKTIFNPKKRCEHLGHKMKTRKINVRKEGGSYRAVVTDYEAKETFCRRCLKGRGELFDLEEVDSYTGCTMPKDMWNQMRKDGYLEL